METYLILRRGAWHDAREAEEARVRAAVEDERFSEVVEWKRSYTIAECDGTFGSLCIYAAVGPEAIRHHAAAARLPVDEIVQVADTADPQPETVSTAAEDSYEREEQA